MNAVPSDILSLIICYGKPSVIERVCKLWYKLSRARRYLGKYFVPAEILLRYPFLTIFEGWTDKLTPEVLDLKCNLTVIQPCLDVEQFMDNYRPGKRLTIKSSTNGYHSISFDGKRLTIKLNMMIPRQYKYARVLTKCHQLKDGLSENMINAVSDMTVFKKKETIDQIMGNVDILNLTCLERAKWGKIDIDVACGPRYMVILPQIQVGLFRFWRTAYGSNSISLILGLMKDVKFDQAEAHINTEILHDDLISCGNIKLVPTTDNHRMFYV